MKTSNANKALSVLLSLTMCTAFVPTTALATETTTDTGTETTQPADQATEGADTSGTTTDTTDTSGDTTVDGAAGTDGSATDGTTGTGETTEGAAGSEETTGNVAKIGEVGYTTLQLAIDAATEGSTVTLVASVTEDVTVASGKNITLDLNGFKVTNVSTHTITNSGTLVITDSSEAKAGTIDNVTHGMAPISNNQGATCTVVSANITRSLEAGSSTTSSGGNSYYYITNAGTMTIGAEGADNSTVTIGSEGHFSSLVHNGWFTGSQNTSKVEAVMTINAGTFKGGINTVKNDDWGVITINGGDFQNATQYALQNWNKATVKGGTFESTTMWAVFTGASAASLGDTRYVNGVTTVHGGTFKSEADSDFRLYNNGAEPTVTIDGGTFSKDPSAYAAEGYVVTTNADATYTVSAGVAKVNDKYYTTLQGAIDDVSGGTITLTSDVTLASSVTVASDKYLTLDLNGKTVTYTDQNSNAIEVEGNLTVKDSTAKQPTVNGATVSGYEGGAIVAYKAALQASNGGKVTLASGKAESTGDLAICSVGNTAPGNTSPIKSSVTVAGGYVLAPEGAVWVAGNGAVANVTGGVLEAKDNAVVAGNGTVNTTTDYGGTEINISGGQLVGHIKSSGYIACGVYHPQAGKLNITGGSIYVDGGVGVLMRAGKASITGGTIQTTGNVSGKVGDSDLISNCYGVFVEGKSGYPGAKTGGLSASVSGNAKILTGSADVPALKLVNSTDDGAVEGSLVVTGGAFSTDPYQYLANTGDYAASLTTDGTYVVGKKGSSKSEGSDAGNVQTSEDVTVNNTEILAADALRAAQDVSNVSVSIEGGEETATATIGGATVKVNAEQATKLNAVAGAAKDSDVSVNVDLVVKVDTDVETNEAISREVSGASAVIPFDLSVDMTTSVYKNGSTVASASVPVTQTASAITATIKVDSTSISGKRVSVARYHDDAVEFLVPSEIDTNTGAITFSTDKFSDYAVVAFTNGQSYELSNYTDEDGSRKSIDPKAFGYGDDVAFAGWYKDVNFNEAYTKDAASGTAYPKFVSISDLITFKGGSLRMDQEANVGTSLRFGYETCVPVGASLDGVKWNYGVEGSNNVYEASMKNYVVNNDSITANIVMTGLVPSDYKTSYWAQEKVTYTTADGTQVTATEVSANKKSVSSVANSISASSYALNADMVYATAIIAAIGTN